MLEFDFIFLMAISNTFTLPETTTMGNKLLFYTWSDYEHFYSLPNLSQNKKASSNPCSKYEMECSIESYLKIHACIS
jgi:hypothetical protein